MKENRNGKLRHWALRLAISFFCIAMSEFFSGAPKNWSNPQFEDHGVAVSDSLAPGANKALQGLSPRELVMDPANRINSAFAIPKGMEDRVSFWIGVYSRYTSADKIIHHLDYPWIQFEVFNISSILAEPSRFKWTNPEKAEKATQHRLRYIQLKLRNLAKKIKGNPSLDSLVLDVEEESYLTAIKELPGSVVSNLRIAAERIRVQTGQRDFFQKGLETAYRYFPHMEEIFAHYDLPVELSRLPMVESSFNWTAVSKVGAGGLWQFMNHTGDKYLTINSFIDERQSPIKSTEAAAKLLQENFRILEGSWPLAVTAWNHGPSGLRKAAKELKTNELGTIIEKFNHRRFSFASENFYAEFLAALFVEKYSSELFGEFNREPVRAFEPYQLTKRVSPNQLFKSGGLSEKEFIEMNPDLTVAVRRNLPLPRGLIVLIPPEKTLEVARLLAGKPIPRPAI